MRICKHGLIKHPIIQCCSSEIVMIGYADEGEDQKTDQQDNCYGTMVLHFLTVFFMRAIHLSIKPMRKKSVLQPISEPQTMRLSHISN